MLGSYSLRQDALAAQNGLWQEGLRPISVSDKGQQREGGTLQAEASISHCIIALLRGRECNCSTNVADWVGARTRFVCVHVCRNATSWGVLRKIPPLRRCGRLDARRLGNSATENLKPSETSGKKGGRFPNTALLRACQGGLFLGPFSGPPFSEAAPKATGNAAFVRRASTGRRSPALKKPRRAFRRRDHRAILSFLLRSVLACAAGAEA